jgi:hypothetical protein
MPRHYDGGSYPSSAHQRIDFLVIPFVPPIDIDIVRITFVDPDTQRCSH